MTYTLQELKDRGMIIFSAIMGSKAYGTSLPTSDTDIRGIFIQPLEDVLKNGYIEQVADDANDIIYYELSRFMNLASMNNPNILELLNAPEDCIQYQTPFSKSLVANRKRFISKICKASFGGYAIQQIKKARGYNKKINWEESDMVRKEVLDFCYVLHNGQSIPVKNYLKDSESGFYKQENYGLAKIDHTHGVYAAYNLSDYNQRKGMVSSRDNVNDVQTVSIPKNLIPEFYMSFNKDAYSTHCKRYSEYQKWLKNRNEDRFKMNKDHGKSYDSKNMNHCVRILNMAREIATKKEIIVRRSAEEIETLMSIRRGEMEYDFLLDLAESLIIKMDSEFNESDLPNKPDIEYLKNLQLDIRKNFYINSGQL